MNPHSKISDSITKFAFKARLGSLFTGIIKAKRHPTDYNGTCPLCGDIETAHHILNGCQHKKHVFSKRHDEVVKIIRDFLNSKRIITHANQVVRNRDYERLNGETSTLKPDLWWWVNNTLSIVEFTIPYGSISNVNELPTSTLDLRRQQKLSKYKPLMEACKAQFNCDVNLYVIIVSSLGALPKETINDLKLITGSNWKRIAKRMVSTSLRESMFIFSNWRPNNSSVPTNDNNAYDTESNVLASHSSSSDHSSSENSDDCWNKLNNDTSHSSVHSPEEHYLTDSTTVTEASDTETETDVLVNDGTTPYWKSPNSSSSSTAESTIDSASPSEDGLISE